MGSAGGRLSISDSKTELQCKIQKMLLLAADTLEDFFTHGVLRFELCEMVMEGEDGTAIGRRKERKFIAVLPERICFFFFPESSSLYGYARIFLHIHVCTDTEALGMRKLGIPTCSFGKE